MQNSPQWSQLHDATLESVHCRWAEGSIRLCLRTSIPGVPVVDIVAKGVRRLDYPRLFPWGPRVSVNEITGPRILVGALMQRLAIEMQSGDLIVVEAEVFQLSSAGSGEGGS